jgi:hypothetical protein
MHTATLSRRACPPRSIRLLTLVLLPVLIAGCNNTTSVEREEAAKLRTYTGLPNQKIATMVWADWVIRTEYNRIQYDVAEAVQNVLVQRSKPTEKEKKPQLANVEFVPVGSVVRYQREHPEIQNLTIQQVAPRLGATRVIYIELEQFQTQPPQSVMLLQGTAKATLRVVEVTAGQAKVAFEDRDIEVIYPPNAPEGVVPTDKVNLRTVYDGTIKELAAKIAKRFPADKD